jgi:hypothetical protein
MTIKELIEKLKSFDSGTLVVVRGMDEYGFADIAHFEMIKLVSVDSMTDPSGDYRAAESKSKDAKKALLIDHC